MISKKSYNITWSKLVKGLLIEDFRNTAMIEFCMSFIKPFSDLLVSKQEKMDSIRYKMSHNAQVIYLEKYLNETYGIVGYDPNDHENTKEIIVLPGTKVLPLFVFQKEDNKPVFLDGTVFIQTQEYIDSEHFDFIIEVPNTLTYSEAELRAHVDFYINTKNYKIIES